MWRFNGKKCLGCEAKNKEIDYLRKLIDNLLAKLDVNAVMEQGLKENFVEEKQEEGVEIIG